MRRHRAIRALLSLLALLILPALAAGRPGPGPRREPSAEMPATGTAVPGMASFDRIVEGIMTKWQIPGGALAVVKDGKLVLARGYGWADREHRQQVEPASLFRLASLSKSLTSAAILKLVEEGRLKLDDRAFGLLRDLKPRAGAKINPRLESITIRQLLEHAGGWDRDQSFDPMFRAQEIARAMGVPSPPDARTIVRYMLDQPLQFAPGTRYAYSNFGYCVLGRIIEATTGGSYEEYVETHILRPAGVTCMRLGHTLEKDRAPREVRYYDFPGNGMAPSVFPGGPAKRPWPYGGWSIEAMDAHGGWIASAVDMARFITALEGRGSSPTD